MVLISRDNLPKIKDGTDIIDHDDQKSKGTHCDSLFIERNTVADSYGIEYIPQEVLDKIKDKSIIHIICKTQGDDSVMFGFYCIACCIALIKHMTAGKTLLDYTNLFSPNGYKK